MFVSRPGEKDGMAIRSPSKGCVEFAKDYPALHEYLTAETYDDGSPRQTSTMLFFVEDGGFKLCFCDRDLDRTVWAHDDSIEECLLSLEAVLSSGTAVWRKSGQRRGAKAKKG